MCTLKGMDQPHRQAKVDELAKLIKDKEDEWKVETDQLQKEYDEMGNQRNQMKVRGKGARGCGRPRGV